MLFTSAVESAFNTMNQAKVSALARVLKENLVDDAKIDLAILIVAALSDLDSPHLRVLRAMKLDEPIRLVSEEFAEGVWPLSGLRKRFLRSPRACLPPWPPWSDRGLYVVADGAPLHLTSTDVQRGYSRLSPS